ncbi:MAG: NAD(P)-dependent oxidoreductase [candidate division Zixibacteria bacterium]|nr:NAD(P)-dependent oxidoreductase [candidate division Zixibacteria bacterium]
MKTGFIGLGSLGRPMAARLIEQGEDLVVWNRTLEKADGLAVEIAGSPADVITRSDTVVLNLFDSEAVEQVIVGDDGLLAGECDGKIVVDTTTNHFKAVPHFHDLLRANGAGYVEAPVLGSVIPASKGLLTIVVSGAKTDYERALPLLEKLGKHIFYLEAPGQATRMKLINNLALGSFMATIAEAVGLGDAIGLTREQTLDILAVGAGNSGVLNAKREKLIQCDYSTHFAVKTIYKDLHCLQDLASELQRPLFTGSITKELFASSIARGGAEDDFSAVMRVVE